MVIGLRLCDRYEVEELIATGGMGTVYRGRDLRLQRPVAVKVLKDHLAHDDRFVERFRREARAVASLTHPNIASLFDYGEDHGHHFIVMEYVDGSDLAEVLTAGAVEPARAREIARQMCAALGAAHRAGIVHRDVKPGNVLLARDGTVKVTDFGIARAAGDATLTATGSILGTSHYLAPEQAAGDPATPATDVYATGIVLFQMLTGNVPFEADSPIAVASKHMREEVPPPSALVPETPADLDDIVRVATAKDPAARYPDGTAMAAALSTPAPAGERTEELAVGAAPTEELPAPASRFPERRVVLIGLGTLALIALVLLAFRLAEDRGGGEGRVRDRRSDRATDERVTTPPATVPDVLGLEVDDAVAQLDALGLVPIVEGEEGGTLVAGVEPPPGSEAPPGTTVTLLVAGTGDADTGEDAGDKPKEHGPPAHAHDEGKGKAKGKEKKDK